MYKTGSCSGLYRQMDLMEKGMISRRTDCTPHTHTREHTHEHKEGVGLRTDWLGYV